MGIKSISQITNVLRAGDVFTFLGLNGESIAVKNHKSSLATSCPHLGWWRQHICHYDQQQSLKQLPFVNLSSASSLADISLKSQAKNRILACASSTVIFPLMPLTSLPLTCFNGSSVLSSFFSHLCTTCKNTRRSNYRAVSGIPIQFTLKTRQLCIEVPTQFLPRKVLFHKF